MRPTTGAAYSLLHQAWSNSAWARYCTEERA